MQLELAKRIVALFNETEGWDAVAELYYEVNGAKPAHGVLGDWFDRAQKMVDDNARFCAKEVQRYRKSVEAADMTAESDWDPEYEAQADTAEHAAWKKRFDEALRAAEKPYIDAAWKMHCRAHGH